MVISEIILEMKNITKEFFGNKALDDVNFIVEKGEIHAICALLIRNANIFVSKEKIINTVWGVYKGIESGNVEIYIHRLGKNLFIKSQA